jgi:hypothetical protein
MRALSELVAGTAASLADTHRPGENHRQGATIPRCRWRPPAARPRELTSPLERGGEDGRIRVRGWRGRGCSISSPPVEPCMGFCRTRRSTRLKAIAASLRHRPVVTHPATFRPPIAPRVPEAFAADVDPETAGLMAATQRLWSGAGYATPSGPPGWRSIPSWYLLCTEDRAIPPAGQRFMAERGTPRSRRWRPPTRPWCRSRRP